MNASEEACVIMTTAGSWEEADRIAEILVEEKLAACVQILDIRSRYIWEGKVCREPEQLLLIKTFATLYPQVEAAIIRHHSYEVPEILQVPVTTGLDCYISWMRENTRPVQDQK